MTLCQWACGAESTGAISWHPISVQKNQSNVAANQQTWTENELNVHFLRSGFSQTNLSSGWRSKFKFHQNHQFYGFLNKYCIFLWNSVGERPNVDSEKLSLCVASFVLLAGNVTESLHGFMHIPHSVCDKVELEIKSLNITEEYFAKISHQKKKRLNLTYICLTAETHRQRVKHSNYFV